MTSKDLSFIFTLSIIGIAFVAIKVISKVLFEWYVLYASVLAAVAIILQKVIFSHLL